MNRQPILLHSPHPPPPRPPKENHDLGWMSTIVPCSSRFFHVFAVIGCVAAAISTSELQRLQREDRRFNIRNVPQYPIHSMRNRTTRHVMHLMTCLFTNSLSAGCEGSMSCVAMQSTTLPACISFRDRILPILPCTPVCGDFTIAWSMPWCLEWVVEESIFMGLRPSPCTVFSVSWADREDITEDFVSFIHRSPVDTLRYISVARRTFSMVCGRSILNSCWGDKFHTVNNGHSLKGSRWNWESFGEEREFSWDKRVDSKWLNIQSRRCSRGNNYLIRQSIHHGLLSAHGNIPRPSRRVDTTSKSIFQSAHCLWTNGMLPTGSPS